MYILLKINDNRIISSSIFTSPITITDAYKRKYNCTLHFTHLFTWKSGCRWVTISSEQKIKQKDSCSQLEKNFENFETK